MITFGKDYYRHSNMTCPACGYVMDASSTVHGENQAEAAPTDGDWSICIACGAVNVYTNGATGLRPPTAEERNEFNADPDVREAVRRVIEAKDQWSSTWPKGSK